MNIFVTLFMALFSFVISAHAADASKPEQASTVGNENYLVVFPVDEKGQYCYAVDSEDSIYSVEDAKYNCKKQNAPKPVFLKKVNDGRYLKKLDDRKAANLQMGDIVDLDGVQDMPYSRYVVRDDKGQNYFINVAKIDGKKHAQVAVITYEKTYTETNSKNEKDIRVTYRSATPHKTWIYDPLVKQPPPPEPVLEPIEPSNVPAAAAEAAPVIQPPPPPQVVYVPVPGPERLVYLPGKEVVKKETSVCKDLSKVEGTYICDPKMQAYLEKPECLKEILKGHCTFAAESCTPKACIEQYKKMENSGASASYARYRAAWAKYFNAKEAHAAASKVLTNCKPDEIQMSKPGVEMTKKALEEAQAAYLKARNELDELVLGQMNLNESGYACMVREVKNFPDMYNYVMTVDRASNGECKTSTAKPAKKPAKAKPAAVQK